MKFPKPERTKNREFLDSFHDTRCVVCSRVGAVAHHVKSKGSGGPDESWNLMNLDNIHHTEVHTIGLTKFSEKYASVKRWLLANDWEFNENKNKWENKRSFVS